MPTADCIEREELRAFTLGCVDDDRFDQIQTHLTECPSCEDTIASFDDTADSLIANVREATRDDVETSESESPGESDALKNALASIVGQTPPPSENRGETSVPRVVERIRDYELVEQLGAGGMGTVYRALHTRLEREVALKLLPARRLRDQAAVARFEREMKAIGRLDHPAIVRATDAGVVDGTHFLAMDYVEGVDVSRLVRLSGPLDVASACEVIRQAAIGLQYAHEQGLIHRDVKPSNLMLNRHGEVRILDLGLALFGAASEAVDELTTVGQLMGTLDYMAPEQCDNSHDVDARADVYSLGATLFKLLSGAAPYDSEGQRTPLAKMKALATIDAPSLADRSEGLPLELIEIVDRSLSRECDDRFASASEMAAALEPFCIDHELVELAERGVELATQADVEPDLPATIPPFVRNEASGGEVQPRLQTASDMQPPGHGTSTRAPSIVRWFLMPIILLAGVVYWIQTDTATLHIECADDNIPIEIRRGQELVRTETLSVGRNELTIRSGNYEIVLPKEYDSLKVEDGRIELTRGGNDYARITRIDRKPDDLPNAPPATATGRQIKFKCLIAEVNPQQLPSAPESGRTALDQLIQSAGLKTKGPQPRDEPHLVGVTDFDVWKSVRALVGHAGVRILAEPVMVAQHGRRATMLSGGEVPYLTPEGKDQVSINWREFGTRMELEPRILDERRLWLDFKLDLSQRHAGGPSNIQETAVPAIRREVVESTLAMMFDQTLLLVEHDFRKGRTLLLAIQPQEITAQELASANVPATDPDTTIVTVPVETYGVQAVTGDTAHVQLVHEGQEAGDLTIRTIVENARIVRQENVSRGDDGSAWCDMTFLVPLADGERLRAAAEADGAFMITVQPKDARGRSIGKIPPGMRLVLVDAYEPLGLSRLTTIGDAVDLLLTFTPRGRDEQDTLPVVRAVEVFLVERGQFGPGEKVEVVPPIRVGVIVSPDDAELLLVARRAGRLGIRRFEVKPDMRPAQQVFEPSLLDPKALETIARQRRDRRANPFIQPEDTIPAGMVAISLPVDRATAGNALIKPGDLIDVAVTYTIRSETGSGKVVKTVEEFLKVFATDGDPDLKTLTVLTTQEKAMRLKLAENVGELHFLLRSSSDSTQSQTAPEDRFDPTLLNGFADNRKMVGILIARTEVKPGDELNDDNVTFREFPIEFTPDNAVTVVEEYQERSVKVKLFPGDFVTIDKLTPKGELQPAPVFSGKTFDQWQHEVLTERNPQQLQEAVKALCILGRGYRDREAAETVLRILEAYPIEFIPVRGTLKTSGHLETSPERLLVMTAIRQLRRLQSDKIVAPIIATFGKKSPLLHRLTVEWLAQPVTAPLTNEPVSLVGPTDPLRKTLQSSTEYLHALLEHWDDLSEITRSVAIFSLSESVNGEETDTELVARLEDIVSDPQGRYRVMAARLLASIRPRADLVDVCLTALEESNPTDHQHGNWWLAESDAWIGLTFLGVHTSESAERVAGLLASFQKKEILDKPLWLSFSKGPGEPVPVSRRMLIYELLGRMGAAALPTKSIVMKSLKEYFGVGPVEDAPYGFKAAQDWAVLERTEIAAAFASRARHIPGVGGGFFSVDDPRGPSIRLHVIDDTVTLSGTVLNAGVLALQRMTGRPVPYADTIFTRQSVPPGGDMAGAGGDEEFSMSLPARWIPVLTTYRGTEFQQWCKTAADLSDPTTPFDQLDQIVSGVSVLRTVDSRRDGAAADAIGKVLRHVLATRTFFKKLDPADVDHWKDAELWKPADVEPIEAAGDIVMTAFSRLAAVRAPEAVQVATDVMRTGSEQARWVVLNRLAGVYLDTNGTVWPYSTEHSRRLNNSPGFAQAVAAQFEEREWQLHSQAYSRELLKMAWRYAGQLPEEAEHLSQISPHIRRLADATKDVFERTELALIHCRSAANSDEPVHHSDRMRIRAVLLAALADVPAGISQLDLVMALQDATNGEIDRAVPHLLAMIREDSSGDTTPYRIRVTGSPYRQRQLAMSGYPGGGGGMAAGFSSAGGMGGMDSADGMPPVVLERTISRRQLIVYALTAMPPKEAALRQALMEELVTLIPTPVKEFVEAKSRYRELRQTWQAGGRTQVVGPGDPRQEVTEFHNAVVNFVLSLQPSEDILKQVFGEAAIATSPSPNLGVYDGRNYAEWLETVKIERSPTKLAEAVRALRLLGVGSRDAEVADTILSAIRLFDIHNFASESPEAQFFYSADDQLRQLDVEAILPSLVTAFRNGNTNQRSFVCVFLAGSGLTPGKAYLDHRRMLIRQLADSAEFRDSILDVWQHKETTPIVQSYLFSLIQDHFIRGEKTHAAIVKVLKHIADSPLQNVTVTGPDLISGQLLSHWEMEFRNRKLRAAFHLTAAAPDHPTLAKVFVDELHRPLGSGQTWWHNRKYALMGLLQLGPRAEDQLPRLVKLLEARSDLKQDADTNDGLFLSHDDAGNSAFCIAQNTRIALVELIALIAFTDQQTPDNAAITVLKRIASQPPHAFKSFERGEEVTFGAAEVRKDSFSLPRLKPSFEQETTDVDLNNPLIELKNGRDRINDVEHLIFQKTAQLALVRAGLDPVGKKPGDSQ